MYKKNTFHTLTNPIPTDKITIMKPTIIVPAYNESAVIVDTLNTLKAYLVENFDRHELIFVDDGSTDNTLELAESIEGIEILSYMQNRGKGHAIKYGVSQATGDVVIFTDADLAYSIGYITTCINILKDKHVDVAIGSRYIKSKVAENHSPPRKLASRLFVWLVRFSLDLKFTDIQCGIKGFKAQAAQSLFSQLHTDGFGFDVELLALAQYKSLIVREFPVKMKASKNSKVRLVRDSFKMIGTIILTKWRTFI